MVVWPNSIRERLLKQIVVSSDVGQMAVAVTGGLLFSLLVTFTLIPGLYLILQRDKSEKADKSDSPIESESQKAYA
ncbi:MAG: hypothetical protein ACOCW1_01245 [Chitinispirillaceae bacterium]